MKKSILIILIFYLSLHNSEAQIWKLKRFEVMAGLGTSEFFGDIGGYSRSKNVAGLRDVSIPQTRMDINGNLRYRISPNLNTRVSLTFGLLHANDSRGSNRERGFEASTSIFEPALLFEYYFVKNRAETSYIFTRGGQAGLLKSLDFYLFSGIGGIYYSIKANDKLKNVGIDPNGYSPVVPFGLGTTLVYSPNINFGVELGGRYAFTDNIDGYSSQYSNSNDVYYFLNFTITFKLKSTATGMPSLR